MRNRITHGYLNVDLDIIWEVIHHDLPTLKSSVRRLLSEVISQWLALILERPSGNPHSVVVL